VIGIRLVTSTRLTKGGKWVGVTAPEVCQKKKKKNSLEKGEVERVLNRGGNKSW